MKLRLYRTWEWKLACSIYEVRFGGNNPMELISSDELQYFDKGVWKPVEVVEEEKPEHPREKKEREHYKKIQKDWTETFKHIKLEDKTLTNLAELIRKS